MPAVAVAAGASIIGGAMQASAARRAANTQARSADRATDMQWDMFNQTRSDQMPWQQAGQNALGRMMEEIGFGVSAMPQQGNVIDGQFSRVPDAPPKPATPDAPRLSYLPNGQPIWVNDQGTSMTPQGKMPDAPAANPAQNGALYSFGAQRPAGAKPLFSGFQKDPGFQFRQQQGNDALNNSLAARGGLMSGNALKAAMDYNSGLASQEYGNYWNRLAGLAGVGQTANNTMASVGQSTAQNVGNSTMQAGNARASGYAARGQAYGNMINGLSNTIGGIDWSTIGRGGSQYPAGMTSSLPSNVAAYGRGW